MNKKNKVIILASIIVGVLVVTLGLTYAVLSFNETKGNSKLVLGDIWMHYNESDTSINITDLMPSENYTNDYFEFTIDGKNTYDKKDISYEIVLSHGDYEGDNENRTIRIDDQLLKFKLVEVVDGEEIEIFGNRTYSDLTNKRIHVDTISSTDNNYSKTYRLYMRVAEYTNICGGDATDGCDYYINPDSEYANLDWNKLFASIKVNVTGDFEEKSIETPGSCFTYEITSIENPTVNPVMDNELSRCVNYLNSVGVQGIEGESLDIFCQGTGTFFGATFQETLDNGGFPPVFLTYFEENNIILKNDDIYIVNQVMASQELNELTSCVTYFSNNSDFSLSEGEDWNSFCQGTGTLNGNTFQTSLDSGILDNYSLDLVNLNVIIATEGTIDLTSYDDSCGPDVVIPREIDGYNITKISASEELGKELGYEAGPASIFVLANVRNVIILDNIITIDFRAFSDNQLTSVEIPNSVTTIGNSAFVGNQLRNIEIPNSVTEIGDFAFNENQLTSIEIPDSVTTIGEHAFSYNQLTSVEIPNSVTEIGDSAFSNNQLTSVEIPNSVTEIGDFAFSNNQLTSVEIPNNVMKIGWYAFSNNQLTSVEIPNSVTEIGDYAFRNNQLTSVEIPNSVTYIGSDAFSWNQLKTIVIGNGVQYIQSSAFRKTSESNPYLESITFTSKTCEEIKNIVIGNGNPNKRFPWLYFSSPYYLEGYKASIIGTDGECVY